MIQNKTLITELLSADEVRLTALANKGLYKRALKDAEGADTDFSENECGAELTVGGERCVIKAPLESSQCSCVARGVCRHILTAVLLLKRQLPEESVQELPVTKPGPAKEQAPEPIPIEENEQPQEQKPLSKKDLDRVHEAADICRQQLSGVLKRGLVREADSACDGFEIAAVRCHAAKMADAERAVREVGSRLKDCIERRAAFDERVFMHRLCECAALMQRLGGDGLTESDLGAFKATYEDYVGTLDILPIGTRSVTEGDYTGNIYYFLNMDERAQQRFLTYSDLRPVFYEGAKRIRRGSSEVWGAGVTLKSLMHSRMSLIGAKVQSGKLSSSAQTTIVSQQRANLNCAALRRLVYSDLREIAIELNSRSINSEADRLFFFRPKRLEGYEFDDMTQQLIITLSDGFGNAVRMSAKYTKYTGEFISQLEAHAKRMANRPECSYVWLVSAYFEDNELMLFPIEMYDFITALEERSFALPKMYEKTDIQAGYANNLGLLFDEAEDRLCEAVRSGIGSSLADTGRLIEKCSDFGLSTLSKLRERFFKTAESYRHSFDDKSIQALLEMADVYRYISLARKKLRLVSALYNMKL